MSNMSYSPRPQTSGLAIASFVTAFVVPFVVPVVLGHLAKSEIRNSGGTKSGSALATWGLVLGYLGTIGTVFIIIGFMAAASTVGY